MENNEILIEQNKKMYEHLNLVEAKNEMYLNNIFFLKNEIENLSKDKIKEYLDKIYLGVKLENLKEDNEFERNYNFEYKLLNLEKRIIYLNDIISNNLLTQKDTDFNYDYCYCGKKTIELIESKLDPILNKVKSSVGDNNLIDIDLIKQDNLNIDQEMEVQIKKWIKEKEEMKIDNSTIQNKFFKSKIYNDLKEKIKELINLIELYKYKNDSLSKEILKLENERLEEMKIIEKTFEENKKNYREEYKKIKIKNETVMIENDKLKKENEFLYQKNKHIGNNLNFGNNFELSNKYKEIAKKQYKVIMKDKEIIKKLTEENSKIKEDFFGKLNLKYTSVKELILKVRNEVNSKELDQIKNYIKIKEEKIYNLSKNIKKLNQEIKTLTSMNDTFTFDIEETLKSYNDLKENYNNIVNENQEYNYQISSLIKDKNKFKLNCEINEKLNLEKTKELENEIKKESNKNKSLMKELEKSKLYNEKLEKIIENHKNEMQNEKNNKNEIKNKLDELDKEKVSTDNNLEIYKKSNDKLYNDLSKYKIKLTHLEKIILTYLDKNFKGKEGNNEQYLNYLLILDEYNSIKKLITCTICKEKKINIILVTCFHVFCESCINNLFKFRNRVCPKCNKVISKNDIKKIYFN